MNDRVLSIIVKARDDASRTISGVGDVAKKVGDAFLTMTKVALVAGAAAAAAFTVASIKNAIDLSESINAVQKTFEGASEKILEFGKTAAETAGLSKAAFNTAVVPIGAMLRNVGFSADEAADSAINLGKRAADLASVFNTSLDDALTAIQAGLRGEADPLERFGVGLSEANVKAYALSKGIATADEEMTTQQKTTARLGLLFEQTNRFAGDFVDTSDEAANKARILSARFENQSAIIGQKLLPAWEFLLDTADSFLKNVSPGLEKGIDSLSAGFGVMWGELQKVAQEVANYLSPKFEELGRVISEDLFPIWEELYNNVVKPFGQYVGTVLVISLGIVVDIFKLWIQWGTSAYNAIKDGLGRLKETLQPGIDWFIANVWPTLQMIGQWIGNEFKKAWDDFKGAIDDIAEAFQKAGVNVDGMQIMLAVLMGVAVAVLAPLIILVATIVGVALAIARVIAWIAQAAAAFQSFTNGIANALGILLGNGIAYFQNFVGNIVNTMQGVAGAIVAPFRQAFNGIVTAWNNTIGRLNIKIPEWIPNIGGNSFSAPKLQHFASGGVVGGSPSMGDNALVATTPGEMILNKSQQSKLFNMINGNASGGGNTTVNFLGQINLGSADAVDRMFERLGTVNELGKYGVGV